MCSCDVKTFSRCMSTVKLRALMVDNLLRPLLDPINKIVIKDPSDIRVMQWTNVSVTATQGTCDVTATFASCSGRTSPSPQRKVRVTSQRLSRHRSEEHYNSTFFRPSYIIYVFHGNDGDVRPLHDANVAVTSHVPCVAMTETFVHCMTRMSL